MPHNYIHDGSFRTFKITSSSADYLPLTADRAIWIDKWLIPGSHTHTRWPKKKAPCWSRSNESMFVYQNNFGRICIAFVCREGNFTSFKMLVRSFRQMTANNLWYSITGTCRIFSLVARTHTMMAMAMGPKWMCVGPEINNAPSAPICHSAGARICTRSRMCSRGCVCVIAGVCSDDRAPI